MDSGWGEFKINLFCGKIFREELGGFVVEFMQFRFETA